MEHRRVRRSFGSGLRSVVSSGIVIGLIAVGLIVASCGGGGGDGGAPPAAGGGAVSDRDAAVGEVQALFGTTMRTGVWQGDALEITLARGAGAGMAKLFCPRVVDILEQAGANPARFRIVEQDTGKELATEASCP